MANPRRCAYRPASKRIGKQHRVYLSISEKPIEKMDFSIWVESDNMHIPAPEI
jgi:hypothetical protein